MNEAEILNLKPQLEQGLDTLGLSLTSEQVSRLMHYLGLLNKWNQIYNLTAIRDPQEMLVKHLLDSLVVVPHLRGETFIDVGTGGGLPGIPLAICFPDKRIDLLDSNSKKTRFLIQAKGELGLTNTKVLHQRVEEYRPQPLYDGVISRAFASLNDMVTWTQDLLHPAGYWWAMKAQKETEEFRDLPIWVEVDTIIELKVPGLDAQRRLIQMHKRSGASSAQS
ncbi:MAG: 16S rRNA (guanine(527)-N(7))-methyltransferase RsmG [Thiotrichales bacterium]|nr:16S rRNA (guanine(527)-N(7))-methyltransferase RsmG [Thiotrichales bacterium]